MTKASLFHLPPSCSLPLGNLTSHHPNSASSFFFQTHLQSDAFCMRSCPPLGINLKLSHNVPYSAAYLYSALPHPNPHLPTHCFFALLVSSPHLSCSILVNTTEIERALRRWGRRKVPTAVAHGVSKVTYPDDFLPFERDTSKHFLFGREMDTEGERDCPSDVHSPKFL